MNFCQWDTSITSMDIRDACEVTPLRLLVLQSCSAVIPFGNLSASMGIAAVAGFQGKVMAAEATAFWSHFYESLSETPSG